jgi:hypothetical protein
MIALLKNSSQFINVRHRRRGERQRVVATAEGTEINESKEHRWIAPGAMRQTMVPFESRWQLAGGGGGVGDDVVSRVDGVGGGSVGSDSDSGG